MVMGISFMVSDDDKIHVDWTRPATLHNGAVSTDWPTLRDAVMAWNRLRPEQAQRASIRIIGGQLYAAREVPKLLNGSRSREASGFSLANRQLALSHHDNYPSLGDNLLFHGSWFRGVGCDAAARGPSRGKGV
jgi:hypothetical protein